MADFNKNLRSYLRHVNVYEMVKGMYDKRQLEIKERARTNNGIIRLDKVTERHLEDAGVSKREFDHIKMLLAVDEEIFKPSEWGSFSNYSQFVDVTKYQDKKLSKDVKEILYRPPKLKNLYQKYWQLAKVSEGLEKKENGEEILKDYRPRFPRKSAEEVNLIEDLFTNLERMIEEDRRNYKPTEAASTQLMQELDEGVTRDQSIYYQSAGVEALNKWKSMTEEERRAAKTKGDDIDAMNTTDLEKYQDEGDDDPGFSEITMDFYEENDINLARAFLGYDGGYSIRKLKKFMKRDKQMIQDEEDDQ